MLVPREHERVAVEVEKYLSSFGLKCQEGILRHLLYSTRLMGLRAESLGVSVPLSLSDANRKRSSGGKTPVFDRSSRSMTEP